MAFYVSLFVLCVILLLALVSYMDMHDDDDDDDDVYNNTSPILDLERRVIGRFDMPLVWSHRFSVLASILLSPVVKK